jgi:hypothetical protein
MIASLDQETGILAELAGGGGDITAAVLSGMARDSTGILEKYTARAM